MLSLLCLSHCSYAGFLQVSIIHQAEQAPFAFAARGAKTISMHLKMPTGTGCPFRNAKTSLCGE